MVNPSKIWSSRIYYLLSLSLTNDKTMTNNRYNKIPKQYVAIVLTCLFGWTFAYLATNVFKDYAFSLFIWLPLVMGASSTILLAYNNSTTKRNCRNISFFTLLIFCVGLLTFALEGIICIVMAAPIGLLFTWIGYFINFIQIVKRRKH